MTITRAPYRIASQVDDTTFPYASRDVCYIEHPANCIELRHLHMKDDRIAALERARRGDGSIYAVWPGRYRSDLFLVDDLDALAAAWKIPQR